MTKKPRETPEEQEARIMRAHQEAQTERLKEVLTRGEMIEIVESIVSDYAQSRDHDLICSVFQRFADALR